MVHTDHPRSHPTGPHGSSVPIPHSNQSPLRTIIPTWQGHQVPSSVTWPSCDNHASKCQGGHLIGCPPCWPTWALRVPASAVCYFCFLYIIDAPLQASGPLSHIFPHSHIGGWVYACLVSCPWHCLPFPSCGQLP